MPTLTRRLQVLLDEERFSELEDLARQRNITVAALVRQALDRAYPRDALPVQAAAERFLARPPVPFGAWEDIKGEIEDSLGRDVTP